MKAIYTKLSALSLGALLALLAVSYSTGGDLYTNMAALTLSGQRLPTLSAYGRQLAHLVDKAVQHVHNTNPSALVTHEDVLTSMCMELGDGYLNKYAKSGNYIKSYSGDYGLTQVKPSTAKKYASRCGMQYSLNRLKTDPLYGVTLGACIKDDLLQKCKRRGFTGKMMRVCAAVAYNGGPGKIDSIPKDGSVPRNCYGKGTPKSKKEGRMSCITVKYAYKTLNECVADINSGHGNRLRSSLWRSLIAGTKTLASGGNIDDGGGGMLSRLRGVGEIARDWWYTPAGVEVANGGGFVFVDDGDMYDSVGGGGVQIVYQDVADGVGSYADITNRLNNGIQDAYIPMEYVLVDDDGRVQMMHDSERSFIPIYTATVIPITPSDGIIR